MGDFTDILYCCALEYIYKEQPDIDWYEDLTEFKKNHPTWEYCRIIKVTFTSKGDELYHEWIEE